MLKAIQGKAESRKQKAEITNSKAEILKSPNQKQTCPLGKAEIGKAESREQKSPNQMLKSCDAEITSQIRNLESRKLKSGRVRILSAAAAGSLQYQRPTAS